MYANRAGSKTWLWQSSFGSSKMPATAVR